jgi:hypothetical protein
MTSLIVENTGGSFERCPPGMHLARCYRVVDLGTQKTQPMGTIKYVRRIMLGWEVHGKDDDGNPMLMKDGRPFSITKHYTLSWSEKANLRKDLQMWRGKNFNEEEMRRFDLKNILGVWCMLNIIDSPDKSGSRIYSNVDGVTPVPSIYKQNGLPTPVNQTYMFSFSDPDWELFETFSDGLKKTIMQSPEFEKSRGGKLMTVAPGFADKDVDDIPF